jgi:hypothetical protein
MSRMQELLARRRLLIARCEEQRLELAQRLAQLHPDARQRGSGAGAPARHPLAWVTALAAMMLLGRTRDVLSLFGWVRTALSIAAGATTLLRLLSRLRAPRSDEGRAAG